MTTTPLVLVLVALYLAARLVSLVLVLIAWPIVEAVWRAEVEARRARRRLCPDPLVGGCVVLEDVEWNPDDGLPPSAALVRPAEWEDIDRL